MVRIIKIVNTVRLNSLLLKVVRLIKDLELLSST